MSTIEILPRPLFAAALVLALAAAPGARAQDRDARWVPWIGCWEPVAEQAGDALLCVRPTDGGVEITDLAGGEARSTNTLRADGREYAIVAEGCTGTSRAQFSEDGLRVYTHTRQACDGDTARGSTGLIAMVTPTEWVDVQAQSDDAKGLSWIRRYRRAAPERTREAGFPDLATDQSVAARRARTAAAAAVDVDDVIEATRSVDAEAVRAWIAEMRDPFDLDSHKLIRMADAGVPASVIDVMIALSYPDRFALSHDGAVERQPVAFRNDPYGRRYPIPIYAYPTTYGYPGSYGYGYGYDAYGWDYYGPTVIVVEPRAPEADAKVVKGKGYTRGTPPSGSSVNDSDKRGSSSGSGSSSSSGSTSSTGTSSSGSSSSEGRTAKPREP